MGGGSNEKMNNKKFALAELCIHSSGRRLRIEFKEFLHAKLNLDSKSSENRVQTFLSYAYKIKSTIK